MSAALWKYRTNTTINDPSRGNVRLNQLDLTQATAMALALTSDNGVDITARLGETQIGDVITMTGSADATKWIKYDVLALPVLQTGWASIALAYRQSQTPTFVTGDTVTLALHDDAVIPAPGVSLEEAKLHLHVTDPARDAEVAMMLAQATASIEQYLGTYLGTTRADLVERGILVMLAHNYEHRGDDAGANDEQVWQALSLLFMQSRNPAIA